jgi:hypothetical protein|tara:strand:- start:249 stop:425 length:177 start_codon:yes stop_codon:yes gene_type:complete
MISFASVTLGLGMLALIVFLVDADDGTTGTYEVLALACALILLVSAIATVAFACMYTP